MRNKEADKKYIFDRDQGICFICGKPVRRNKMTLDHYYPRSLGGVAEVYNLVCCCKQCNRLKRSQIPRDWESVNILLLQRAIMDKRLNMSRLSQSHEELIALSGHLKTIIHNRLNTVFEGPGIRFYVQEDVISKIVFYEMAEPSKFV